MNKVTVISKALAILLFVSLPFVGLYVGIKYQKSITIVSPCNCQTQKPSVTPSPKLFTGIYRNEKYNYNITIPKDWTLQLNRDQDLQIKSYDLVTTGDGYGSPVQGAEIAIHVSQSNFENLNTLISDLKLGYKTTYMNPRYVVIDGIKAIQYEWFWEGWGTSTQFIKNGKLYNATIFYNLDQTSHKKYIDDYNKIIKTILFEE